MASNDSGKYPPYDRPDDYFSSLLSYINNLKKNENTVELANDLEGILNGILTDAVSEIEARVSMAQHEIRKRMHESAAKHFNPEKLLNAARRALEAAGRITAGGFTAGGLTTGDKPRCGAAENSLVSGDPVISSPVLPNEVLPGIRPAASASPYSFQDGYMSKPGVPIPGFQISPLEQSADHARGPGAGVFRVTFGHRVPIEEASKYIAAEYAHFWYEIKGGPSRLHRLYRQVQKGLPISQEDKSKVFGIQLDPLEKSGLYCDDSNLESFFAGSITVSNFGWVHEGKGEIGCRIERGWWCGSEPIRVFDWMFEREFIRYALEFCHDFSVLTINRENPSVCFEVRPEILVGRRLVESFYSSLEKNHNILK